MKKKKSLFQNKIRIRITLLYEHDACVKIFEIYTISLQKQRRNKQLIILLLFTIYCIFRLKISLTGTPLYINTKSTRAFEP
jgi:hypothetical protein